VSLFGFSILFFCFSLDYFVLILFAFVVLDVVSSLLCQKIGWELVSWSLTSLLQNKYGYIRDEHWLGRCLWNDLFCVKWDV